MNTFEKINFENIQAKTWNLSINENEKYIY